MSKPVMKIAVKKGKATVSVKCLEGQSCVTATKSMEHALGRVEDDELTSDFYKNPPETVRANA